MTDGPDSPIEDYTAPPNGSPPSTSTDSTVLIPPPSFPTEGITSVLTHDPPPPYPTPGRSRRPRGPRRSLGHHQQLSSGDSMDASETTTLLSPPRQGPGPGPRPRSNSNGSLWSNISGSPSLAHTMYTFFDGNEDDEDGASVRCNALYSPVLRRRSSDDDQVPATRDSELADVRVEGRESKWRAYWRPVTKKTYYASVVHLMLVNFPMALFSWIALFVFTLLGTTLLMVLPLGLLLCFIDLLCARLLTRFELYLQITFHFPHAVIRRKPAIFTRRRPSPSRDEESPLLRDENLLLDETSFYKNSYAMFTDPTSYTSLFYFLVIKPPITLSFTLISLIVILPLMLSIIGAPLGLRMGRRLGLWQARVAVEGLATPRDEQT